MSQGIDQMRAEMARQHEDARQSLTGAGPMAARIAADIRQRGRLLLIGMGGSHWVNRAACPAYRVAGIDATCHVASEYMRAPLGGAPAMLLTSQSGESGEIVRFLDMRLASDAAFGLTLAPDSALARRLPSLVGAGGPEAAYAATRSQLIALALHAAILDGLGAETGAFSAALAGPVPLDPLQREAATRHLAAARSAVMVARAPHQGAMDAAALCLMETARIPVLGLEAGQFRHGPFEMVSDATAIVMLRAAGTVEDDLAPLARECLRYGLTPVIFDASGQAPVAGAITLTLPAASGLALVASALPALQDVLVAAAERMLPDAGLPKRSDKVTSGEAA